MPQTAILFLVAALAICGLPPFNGFVSEFLIYYGLFNGMEQASLANVLLMLFSIFGLVLIGGLALFCFTKAFGIVFLGTPRHPLQRLPAEAVRGQLIPMYLVLSMILSIGLFPGVFLHALSEPLRLFTARLQLPREDLVMFQVSELMRYIGLSAAGFILLVFIVYAIRKHITAARPVAYDATWGCGYVGNTQRMQFTASAYVRGFRKLAEPMLTIRKKKREISGIFPQEGWHETHPHDKLEIWLIDRPVRLLRFFFGKFRFLQNGNPQYYVLYGVIFISLVMAVPLLKEALLKFMHFLNQI